MTDSADLNAQIAYRLFGAPWRFATASTPAYTTDPAATARVWAWVAGAMPYERNSQDHRRGEITFVLCPDEQCVRCDLGSVASRQGATWQEALCRAALALEEIMENG